LQAAAAGTAGQQNIANLQLYAAAAQQLLGAAQQQMARVPLGTLTDAWQPCPLLSFEGTLPANEDTLQARADSTQQSKANDPDIILQSLQRWREKYLAHQQRGAPPHDLERVKDTVEALRARAYLLYQQERSVKLLQNTRVSDSWLHGASAE
jgi:6-phosphofructokinase